MDAADARFPPGCPLASLDGTIWYTGQMANALGHIDPTTGRITEYRLDTPMSGPHGLVADRDGSIWFTANFARLHRQTRPRHGKSDRIRIAEPGCATRIRRCSIRAASFGSPCKAANGGSLDPKTGEVKLVTSPTPRSNPYGIVITSKGTPYFDSVAWRAAIATLWRCVRQRSCMVPANPGCGQTRSCGSIGKRKIPNLDHPVGRRRRAQHDDQSRREYRDGRERRRSRRPG